MSEESRNHTDSIEKLHERSRDAALKRRERGKQTAERLRERNREVAEKLASNAGSFVENSIGSFIEHRQEAPILTDRAESGTW